MKKVIIDAADKHDVSVDIILLIYKKVFWLLKRIMREADDNAWPMVRIPGLGYLRPNIPRDYRKKKKYYETPIKLRFKYKLLGGKPSAYHPEGIPDHLWE